MRYVPKYSAFWLCSSFFNQYWKNWDGSYMFNTSTATIYRTINNVWMKCYCKDHKCEEKYLYTCQICGVKGCMIRWMKKTSVKGHIYRFSVKYSTCIVYQAPLVEVKLRSKCVCCSSILSEFCSTPQNEAFDSYYAWKRKARRRRRTVEDRIGMIEMKNTEKKKHTHTYAHNAHTHTLTQKWGARPNGWGAAWIMH